MSDVDDLEYCKAYLRRKYPIGEDEGVASLAALAAMADQVFSSATDEVTVTSVSSEGGATGGQKNFNRRVLGQAIEAILAERGADYVSPASGLVIQFSP
jgi:hypothetical protein